MAHDMLEEGLIDADEALLRVDANRLEELFKRRVEGGRRRARSRRGSNASPGAATGRVVFSADDAQEWASRGEQVILVRRETTPDDYHGMIAAQGILTSAGGTNSHAAVVARGEGIPAVCGADAIKLDPAGEDVLRERRHRERGRRHHDRRLHGQRVPGRAAARGVGAGEGAERRRRPRGEEKIWKAFERLMRTPTRSGGSASARTPTRPTRPRTPASAAPRASACAGPSTCSWGRSGSSPCGR